MARFSTMRSKEMFAGTSGKMPPQSPVGLPEGKIPLFLKGVLENTKSRIPSALRYRGQRQPEEEGGPRRGGAANETGTKLACRGGDRFWIVLWSFRAVRQCSPFIGLSQYEFAICPTGVLR